MSQPIQTFQDALSRVSPGRWVIAVSGGADSVALLHLMVEYRPDVQLMVAHLDHQTRAGASGEDARFVMSLAEQYRLPTMLHRRDELERDSLPANAQARYRALRLELYRRAIARFAAQGVLQAHHADDQAETLLLRLSRGCGIEGLCGISPVSIVDGVMIHRPLLGIFRESLRAYLIAQQYPWREDSSNALPVYQRNQVRTLLSGRPELVKKLLGTAEVFNQLHELLQLASPEMTDRLRIQTMRQLPPLVQLHHLRQWAIHHGAVADDLTIELLNNMRRMIEDAAVPPGMTLPGNLEIRRRGGDLISQRKSFSCARSCNSP